MVEWLARLQDFLGRTLAWLVSGVVLLVFVLTVLRYFFNLNWIALQELAQYLHATAFMLAMGWVLRRDEHVRVDILYRRFTARTKARVNVFGSLFLLLPAMVYLLLDSMPYVLASWRILEGSREAGGLAGVFLLKSLIPLMALLLILQAVVLVLRHGKVALYGERS